MAQTTNISFINTLVPDLADQLNSGVFVQVFGTDQNNTLRGNEEQEFIDGQGGDDRLKGRDNDDILFGGSGNDRLFGENDNDVLDGGLDNDRLYGGAGDDLLIGGFGKDALRGQAGNDEIYGDEIITADDFDSEGYFTDEAIALHGNDSLKGEDGDDFLEDQLGKDRLVGGDGDDTLVSISDSNVPAENLAIGANVDDGDDIEKLEFVRKYYNPDDLKANDKLTGGAGADTFKFDLLINAKQSIYEQHIQDDGSINWGMNGVAGENNNYHDHWVDGIGYDLITDFSGSGGEGDAIVITGHTVKFTVLKEKANRVKLGIYSDQGNDGVRGGGAHDMDVLGVIFIKHDGNFDVNADVTLTHADLGSF